MPDREPDRVQREIEELLDKLDNFVPEERLVSKIRNRRRAAAGPNIFQRAWARIGHISLGHVMLAGIAMLLAATLLRTTLGPFATPMLIIGLVLTIGAFVLSFINRDARRTIAGGQVEKRWRGQTISYDEPSTASRLRGWFRRKKR